MVLLRKGLPRNALGTFGGLRAKRFTHPTFDNGRVTSSNLHFTGVAETTRTLAPAAAATLTCGVNCTALPAGSGLSRLMR